MIRCFVDNTQAISAVKKGYSKKLRSLSRTQRVSIGVIHELVEDDDMMITVQHCPTAEMKGDLVTKALLTPAFLTQRFAIGVVPEDA